MASPATSPSGWVEHDAAMTAEPAGTRTTTYEGAGEFSRRVAVLPAVKKHLVGAQLTPS